ncbi:hypothetical protein LWI29_023155 [Acer saccharum]|uniref:Peroxidase n=1 Tax=Acer saccharum TaxID=4024 RepID=A0AA39VLF3_ACESA|nr:hypothetical protein LWI29_023155 [Acer saccharum]
MMVREGVVTLILIELILAINLATLSNGDSLQLGFYRGKCGFADVEIIVADVVNARFIKDPTIVAALLRLHFHDCFVNGCDASILIDGSYSEKTAAPNLSLRGYDVIDDAKAAVDRLCPGVVSCADLIAIAARDAVFLSGGGRYEVQTGRRDGLISLAQNVSIPGPSAYLSQVIPFFLSKGLTLTDMVVLLGAHSVGVVNCTFIKDRLYNFRNTGIPDLTMEPFLANELRFRCPSNTTVDSTVKLDQNPFPFLDNSYYMQILSNRGVLRIDQELAMHPLTRAIVMNLARGFDFPTKFGAAMLKMGAIQVLTGTQGEIRTSCRATTNRPHISLTN